MIARNDITQKTVSARSRKYDEIQSVVRNGPSVLHAKSFTPNVVMKRRGEVFARLTAGGLRQLIADGSASQSPTSPVDMNWQQRQQYPITTTTAASGGPLRVTVHATEGTSGAASLLLDVRPVDEYNSARVAGAVSSDAVLMRRDKLPAALVTNRTRSDVVIVVYDLEETNECRDIATKLCNLGYQNVHVLSGGLKAVAADAPELIEGPEAGVVIAQVDHDLADKTRPPRHLLMKSTGMVVSTAPPSAGYGPSLDAVSTSYSVYGQAPSQFFSTTQQAATATAAGRAAVGTQGPRSVSGASTSGFTAGGTRRVTSASVFRGTGTEGPSPAQIARQRLDETSSSRGSAATSTMTRRNVATAPSAGSRQQLAAAGSVVCGSTGGGHGGAPLGGAIAATPGFSFGGASRFR